MKPRATINVRRLPIAEQQEVAPTDYWRPSTRSDCDRFARPCPYVSCRHHLYLEVKRNGNIRLNFPHLEPGHLTDSCSLDVADEGEHTLMAVGDALGITREMVRQMEAKIFEGLPINEDGDGLAEVEAPEAADGLGRDGVREVTT